MKTKCDWCGASSENLTQVETATGREMICNECLIKHNDHICITCGEDIEGETSVHGECLACMQVRSAETDRVKDDIESGATPEDVEDTVDNTPAMSEKEFDTWMKTELTASSPAAKNAFMQGYNEFMRRKKRDKA